MQNRFHPRAVVRQRYRNDEKKATPEAQNVNRPRDKMPGSEQAARDPDKEGNESTSPGTTRDESSSKGQTAGDRKGGGPGNADAGGMP